MATEVQPGAGRRGAAGTVVIHVEWVNGDQGRKFAVMQRTPH